MSEHYMSRELTYSCGHTRVFKSPYPKRGDTQWCLKCRKEVTVMNAPNYWRLRCHNCVYNRTFGASRDNCVMSIAKHRQNHPGHIVSLYDGNTFEMKYGEPVTESDGGVLF